MTTERKLRSLANANAGLLALLGSPPAEFRWFDTQLAPNFQKLGVCVRVRRIATETMFSMQGLNPLRAVHMQIDVLHANPETARAAATAVITFLGTVDLASTQQFSSPATTPRQFPCFLMNQRTGLDYNMDPPVYVESLDVRIYSEET